MLRVALIITILIIFLDKANSQISFGPKAGINLATWTTEGSNTITGFQGGAVVHFPLNEKFSLQTELLFEGKGTNLGNFIPNNPILITMKYLTLNALLGYKIRGVTLMAGAYVSDSLSFKLEVNNEEIEFPAGFVPFEKWDWGIATGATLSVTPAFGFEVLYYFGFPDIPDITFGDQNGNFIAHLGEGKNRVLQLGMYYKFNSE